MTISRLRLILAVLVSALLYACTGAGENPDLARDSGEARKAPDAAAIRVAPATPGSSDPAGIPQPPMTAGRDEAPAAEPASGQDPAPEMILPEDQGSPDQPLAADPVEPPRGETVPSAGGARVFSNKDLEKYREVKRQFGFGENAVQVDVSGQSRGTTVVSEGDPADDLLPEEMDREIESARLRVNALTQELDHLRRREASLHNPFLPRPETTDQDKLAEAGMDNVERLERVRARIAEIEEEIHELRNRTAELSQARARGSSAPR